MIKNARARFGNNVHFYILLISCFHLSDSQPISATCTVPTIENGGYFNCNPRTSIQDNGSCNVRCDPGYRATKPQYVCKTNGISATPVCQESTCYSYESCLKLDLFSDYDQTVRPVLLPLHTLNITVELHIQALTAIKWTDQFLKWNHASYGETTQMVVIANKLWLPDTVIINSADSYYKSIYKDDFRAQVKSTGRVTWSFGGHISTKCALDLTYYPFDAQTCFVLVRNWLYNARSVDLKLSHTKAIGLKGYQEHGLWELIDMEASKTPNQNDDEESKSQVPFMLKWKRKPMYYVLNIIVPSLFIMVITLAQFWLPAGSGEKVSLGITVLLAFSVFQLIINESTPVNSDTSPLISRMVLFVMAMATLSLLFAIASVFIDSQSSCTRLPKWFRLIIFKHLARGLCMSREVRKSREQYGGGEIPRDVNNKVSPKRGSEKIKGADTVTKQQVSTPKKSMTMMKDGKDGIYIGDIMTGQITKDHQATENENEMIMNEWKLLSKLIDRFLFWVSLIIVLLYFTIVGAELKNAREQD